jgi:hypothetical protein
MTTNLDAYRQQLLFALRVRNVPGPRIGEAIAEVESHIAETGEDPVTAFGEPAEYAQHLADQLARSGRRRSRGLPTTIVVALVAFAGAALAANGLLRGVVVATALGLVLLTGLVIWVVRRRPTDRIVDPRTGTDLRVPAPRWALVVLAVSLTALVVIAVAVRWSA